MMSFTHSDVHRVGKRGESFRIISHIRILMFCHETSDEVCSPSHRASSIEQRISSTCLPGSVYIASAKGASPTMLIS